MTEIGLTDAPRRGQAIDTPKRVAKLLKKQKGKYNWCGQYLHPMEATPFSTPNDLALHETQPKRG
jgi:putative methionine-R-sulfoxide reductase with GAF domain